MGLYSTLLRPLAFALDPERAHGLAIEAGATLAWASGLVGAVARPDPLLATRVAGIDFPSPVGLAAGFDKSADAVELLAALGFGFVEVGSVSADASAGNPRPRLFRLPQDRAILVAYGVPNDGAGVVAVRLAHAEPCAPVGVNIVATNRGPGRPPPARDDMIADYVAAAKQLAPRAAYLMFNLSCPNTEDGRDAFADRGCLSAWLDAMAEAGLGRPVFLKVSPLGGPAAIEALLEAVDPHPFVSGFMFNLPALKPDGLRTPPALWRDRPGAVAGPPAAALLDAALADCHRRMDRRRHVLFASGGVTTGACAYARIRAGAALVGLVTALVYEGPGVARRINRELAALLARDGFSSVSEAVGADPP